MKKCGIKVEKPGALGVVIGFLYGIGLHPLFIFLGIILGIAFKKSRKK